MEVDKIIVDELSEVEETKTEEIKAEETKTISIPFGSFLARVPQNRLSKHQMSKRGARHEHKATFKSKDSLPMTPAQYRRYHFGAKQKETK